MSARGAGVGRECSTGRPERYEHQGCPGMHAARGTAAAFYTTHHNSIHFTWISYVSMPSIAAQKIKKNTLELFGAVQEPVRPDARETNPMGQGRTWRTLDAAAQIYGQVPIGIIRT